MTVITKTLPLSPFLLSLSLLSPSVFLSLPHSSSLSLTIIFICHDNGAGFFQSGEGDFLNFSYIIHPPF